MENVDEVLEQLKERFFRKIEIQEEWHRKQIMKAYDDSTHEVFSDILKKQKKSEEETILKYAEEKGIWSKG